VLGLWVTGRMTRLGAIRKIDEFFDTVVVRLPPA